MPIYDDGHLEHNINSGKISIVTDDGGHIPAYWAHPDIGRKFSGIVLIHDWWGLTDLMRRLANFFAQMGYYVIVPDLFEGHTASTPQDALRLVEQYRTTSYPLVHTSLGVLESHHRCNRDVAAIGVGLGGSLAFQAAIERNDLEAAVAYGGFPQNYLGKFAKANTPIFAVYGQNEPFTKPPVIRSLAQELAQTDLGQEHKVAVIEGLGHDFFSENAAPQLRAKGREVLNQTLDFIEKHVAKPRRPNYNDVI